MFSFKFNLTRQGGVFILKKREKILFVHVLLNWYVKFQHSTISGSGKKVCILGGGGVGVETDYRHLRDT